MVENGYDDLLGSSIDIWSYEIEFTYPNLLVIQFEMIFKNVQTYTSQGLLSLWLQLVFSIKIF